ncbi:hypothetical protein DdX_20219 [Ditylenchus destructor]|uniref:Uncharacterized protein n=1 Tax=Ditylenchus destructor TaxID=166010 RepID=A0AAD4QRX9_9BILA|nr:hypothetical protein DdX_20219 [Ditylenchus destructor]
MRTVTTYDVERMRKTLTEGAPPRLRRPEGGDRRGRMPAGAPAPHQALDRQPAEERRARGAREVRRRRGRVQRRPRLHPPVGLPPPHAAQKTQIR